MEVKVLSVFYVLWEYQPTFKRYFNHEPCNIIFHIPAKQNFFWILIVQLGLEYILGDTQKMLQVKTLIKGELTYYRILFIFGVKIHSLSDISTDFQQFVANTIWITDVIGRALNYKLLCVESTPGFDVQKWLFFGYTAL